MSSYLGSLRYKDFLYPVTYGHNEFEMPTAIISTYTPNGFVIGADGLRKGSDGTVDTETAQKVFSVEGNDFRLAYAWAGTTRFISESGEEFDFIKASSEILAVGRLFSARGFVNFVDTFNKTLYQMLIRSPFAKKKRYCGVLSKDEIARLVLLGYFDNQPCTTEIFVRHKNLVVLEPTAEKIEIPVQPNLNIFSGPLDEAETFPQIPAPESNEQAANLIREYIKRWVDSQEANCANIGGHIHIGAITPNKFAWIDPPSSS